MYSVNDLGPGVWPIQLNSHGDILANPDGNPDLVVVRLANGTEITPPAGIGGRAGYWSGLSDNGYALVLQYTDSKPLLDFSPVLFHVATNTVQQINVPDPGFGPIAATSLDRDGNIAGVHIKADGPVEVKGFLWDRTTQTTTYIPTAVTSDPTTHYLTPLGRNTRGHAVGYQSYYESGGYPPSYEIPFYYDGTTAIEIPALDAPSFVGCCRFITENDVMTIGYDDGAVNGLYVPGSGFTALPISKYIVGLNASRSILWRSNAGGSSLTDAGGSTRPLEQLFPSGSGWSQAVGTALNDSGQIAGTGMHNGTVHGFVLTPIVKPRPTILRIPANVRTRPVINPIVWGQLNAPSRAIQGATRTGKKQ